MSNQNPTTLNTEQHTLYFGALDPKLSREKIWSILTELVQISHAGQNLITLHPYITKLDLPPKKKNQPSHHKNRGFAFVSFKSKESRDAFLNEADKIKSKFDGSDSETKLTVRKYSKIGKNLSAKKCEFKVDIKPIDRDKKMYAVCKNAWKQFLEKLDDENLDLCYKMLQNGQWAEWVNEFGVDFGNHQSGNLIQNFIAPKLIQKYPTSSSKAPSLSDSGTSTLPSDNEDAISN